jgi:hypothetical protein
MKTIRHRGKSYHLKNEMFNVDGWITVKGWMAYLVQKGKGDLPIGFAWKQERKWTPQGQWRVLKCPRNFLTLDEATKYMVSHHTWVDSPTGIPTRPDTRRRKRL